MQPPDVLILSRWPMSKENVTNATTERGTLKKDSKIIWAEMFIGLNDVKTSSQIKWGLNL